MELDCLKILLSDIYFQVRKSTLGPLCLPFVHTNYPGTSCYVFCVRVYWMEWVCLVYVDGGFLLRFSSNNAPSYHACRFSFTIQRF